MKALLLVANEYPRSDALLGSSVLVSISQSFSTGLPEMSTGSLSNIPVNFDLNSELEIRILYSG